MKHQNWIACAAALACALASLPAASAQTAAATDAAPPINAAPRINTRLVKQLEEMFQKPLTDAQKRQVTQAAQDHGADTKAAQKQYAAATKAAWENYDNGISEALGITPDELRAKESEMRKLAKARKKAPAAGGTTSPSTAARSLNQASLKPNSPNP